MNLNPTIDASRFMNSLGRKLRGEIIFLLSSECFQIADNRSARGPFCNFARMVFKCRTRHVR